MLPASLIIKKRNGERLSAEEIQSFIDGFVSGEVADYQMSAMAMAICWQGMDAEETTDLTQAMLDSGERLQRSSQGPPRVDKHSTGGLGDKISLILAPLLASCGVHVPMISGRGLGHTGGTLDKLESIPGFRVDWASDEAEGLLEKIGCFIIGANQNIAPADQRLYALRDVTGTIESVPLITASILSKKLAASLDALVMDVKVGSGAFMQSSSDAIRLAHSIVATGHQAGLPTTAFVSDMDQPLGHAVGNAIEVNESVDVLQGKGPSEVRELTLQLCSSALCMTKVCQDVNQARQLLSDQLNSGRAFERFCEMVFAQGGQFVDKLSLESATPILASHSGYLAMINNRKLGECLIALGGGRRRLGDPLRHGVGLHVAARIGDSIERGMPIATLHASSALSKDWIDIVRNAFHISNEPVQARELIQQRIDQSPTLPNELRQRLIIDAQHARQHAYAPFSRFQVGAAIATVDGRIFTGCNIENASFSATICAERVAAGNAISAGAGEWLAIALATSGGAAPCGICRQFLSEFSRHLPLIIVDTDNGEIRHRCLSDLLPNSFASGDIRPQ